MEAHPHLKVDVHRDCHVLPWETQLYGECIVLLNNRFRDSEPISTVRVVTQAEGHKTERRCHRETLL